MEAISVRTEVASRRPEWRVVGRYVLGDEIAAGGMAAIHLGRLVGPGGMSRTLAIKRLLSQFAADPEFVAMFLDEARLATRISHPNVVSVLELVTEGAEIFLVMEYVRGAPLSLLRNRGKTRPAAVPPPIAVSILSGVLCGLHAAHEATDESGACLDIVHRDVSPQNVLVGADGVARILDFGIAKAMGRLQTTQKGQLKGKLSYMAPEQIDGSGVSPLTDVYAASVVLWEALTGQRLFLASDEKGTLGRVFNFVVPPPSSITSGLSPLLDRVVLRGLDRDPSKRFGSAREMVQALSTSCRIASPPEVADWVNSLAHDDLARAQQIVTAMEQKAAGNADDRRDLAARLAAYAAESPPRELKKRPPPAPESEPPPSGLHSSSDRKIDLESRVTSQPPQERYSSPPAAPGFFKRASARPSWRTIALAATLLLGVTPRGWAHWLFANAAAKTPQTAQSAPLVVHAPARSADIASAGASAGAPAGSTASTLSPQTAPQIATPPGSAQPAVDADEVVARPVE